MPLAVIFYDIKMFKVTNDIPKLFADFNNANTKGRLRLTTNGTLADIKRLNLELKEGMQVFIDDNDTLTTIGYIRYSDEEKIWVAEINWNDIQHSDNLLDGSRKIEIEKQFKNYRQLLQNAKSIETDKSLEKQYDLHLNWLDKIEIAFNNNDIILLTNLIEQESRSYGWSYLPNDYGEKVETAFWNLKKLINDKG